MAKKNQNRKETEASKFLANPSEEGQENADVAEGEGEVASPDQAGIGASLPPEESEPKPQAKAAEEVKPAEGISQDVPGKYRKFQK